MTWSSARPISGSSRAAATSPNSTASSKPGASPATASKAMNARLPAARISFLISGTPSSPTSNTFSESSRRCTREPTWERPFTARGIFATGTSTASSTSSGTIGMIAAWRFPSWSGPSPGSAPASGKCSPTAATAPAICSFSIWPSNSSSASWWSGICLPLRTGTNWWRSCSRCSKT